MTPLLLLLLAGCSLHLIYLYLIRPLAIQRIRYGLYGMRDSLRLAALAGEIPADDGGYRIMESHLNAAVNAVWALDIAVLFEPASKELKMEAMRETQILDSSCEKIRQIRRQSVRHCLAAIAFNSPILVLALPLVAVALVLTLFLTGAEQIKKSIESRAWAAAGDPALCAG